MSPARGEAVVEVGAPDSPEAHPAKRSASATTATGLMLDFDVGSGATLATLNSTARSSFPGPESATVLRVAVPNPHTRGYNRPRVRM
jgi:hypothetical protein